jgi:hypothetical protein
MAAGRIKNLTIIDVRFNKLDSPEKVKCEMSALLLEKTAIECKGGVIISKIVTEWDIGCKEEIIKYDIWSPRS